MAITNSGTAHWEGGLKDGNGTLSMGSGTLTDTPYNFTKRFEGEAGTNPEELIAASHAACFSMAFSMMLGKSELTADAIDTKAVVTLDQVDGGFAITQSALICTVKCAGDADAIREAAEGAKGGCPISKLLNCEITLDLIVTS